MAQSQAEAQRVALQEAESLGQTDLTGNCQAPRSHYPLKENQAQPRRLELGEDPFRAPRTEPRELGLGCPDFEEPFDRPAHTVDQPNLGEAEPGGRDVGDEASPIQEGEFTGRAGTALGAGSGQSLTASAGGTR